MGRMNNYIKTYSKKTQIVLTFFVVLMLVLVIYSLITLGNNKPTNTKNEITIISPLDGDVLRIDNSYYIKWKNTFDAVGYSVSLCVADSPEPDCFYIDNKENDYVYKSNIYIWNVKYQYGNISWKDGRKSYVGESRIRPDKYFIHVCNLKPFSCNSSDHFEVVN